MARSFHPATRALLLGLACVATAATAACADGESGSEPAAKAAAASEARAAVAVQLFQYQPSPLEIAAGTVVTWSNRDEILHTATSGLPGAADGQFNGTMDGKDTSYQFTFSQPGTYSYFCARHESMRGEVRVR
jgi:plastocyanin